MNPPTRLYMSMSLDGFIAGPGDRAGQELGRDGGRLFNWLDDRMSDGPNGQVFREAMATGAVISGRRTFELAGRWQGDHHDGVPIFVLTHRIDDADVPPGSARFVTDVEDCAGRARAAAGDRAVMVHGAGAAQALLRQGCSTNWRSTSSRSCSVTAGGCSTHWVPTTSSSNWCGCLTRQA
jgi:dihydrofolate reductase